MPSSASFQTFTFLWGLQPAERWCSLQLLRFRADFPHPVCWPMFASVLGNTLTDSLIRIRYQFSRHSLAQSSWPSRLTTTVCFLSCTAHNLLELKNMNFMLINMAPLLIVILVLLIDSLCNWAYKLQQMLYFSTSTILPVIEAKIFKKLRNKLLILIKVFYIV